MPMYRCTRPEVYDPGCPGHTDPTARQGYYIEADSERAALFRMHEKFPEDTKFDIYEWKG